MQRSYAHGHRTRVSDLPLPKWLEERPQEPQTTDGKTNPSPWSAGSSARGRKENDAHVGFGGRACVIAEV